jgi:hypothetical protein
MKKQKLKYTVKKGPLTDSLEFCTNCDGLEEFAVGSEVKEVSALYERFHNCETSGKFEGDLCSRLFIATESTSLEESKETGEDEPNS